MKQIFLFLTTLLLSCCSSDNVIKAQNMDKMYITIGDQTQSITLADNDATRTLIEKLPVTVTLNSSGDFEIWGPATWFSTTAATSVCSTVPIRGATLLWERSKVSRRVSCALS